MKKMNVMLVLGVFCGVNALAQDGSGLVSTGERKAGSVNMGGVFVTPTIDVLMGNNSNVTAASAASGKPLISSSVLSLRPGFVADIERRGDKYQASYFGKYDRYASSTDDNINDHDARVTGQNYLTPQMDVNWGLRYGDLHDPRSAIAVVSVPLNYKSTELKARGGYGAEGAPGRIEVYGGSSTKRYQTFASAMTYNLDSLNVGTTLYYRITPKTRLLADISQTNSKYPEITNPSKDLSNVERKYLLGATWDLLAATQGTIKGGYFSKHANSASTSVRDATGFSLEGSVNWKPLTYTEFIAQINRGASEAFVGATGFSIGSGGSLTWNHAWRSYVKSMLNVTYQTTDMHVGTLRTDKATGINGSVMYDLTRNLGVGMEYGYAKRDSTDPLFNYDQRRVMLKVAASL